MASSELKECSKVIGREVSRCRRCLYNSNTPGISFDSKGICSYCELHDELEQQYRGDEHSMQELERIVARVKQAGRGKKYDCVIGVSGGCDSSYMVHLAVTRFGLRPLAVHFDNTWNSTIATENIAKVLGKLNVDLFTYVVDNREYDDIYRSFMSAGVPDLEAPTDIGLASTLNLAAAKHRLRYAFEGHNFRTEGVAPLGWLYMDGRYIAALHRQFGSMPMKTFPNMSLLRFFKWMLLNRVRKIRPLWYMNYDKEEAKTLLSKEYGWTWYGGHHLENRFTAFYHSYFLPRRFGWDLRVISLSAMVRSGQLSREEGLAILDSEPYLEPDLVPYVKKRLRLTDEEFAALMCLPKKSYKDYPTYKQVFERLRPFFWLMSKLKLVPDTFYRKYTLPA